MLQNLLRAAVASSLTALIGCGQSLQFRAIDAVTRRPLEGVQVERHRTKHYGSLRISGKTTVDPLGKTDSRGRFAADDVTGDDAIFFEMENYWPATVYQDLGAQHIKSLSYDREAADRKTGLPDIDLILAIRKEIRRRVFERTGISEGGHAVEKEDGVILVPLYPIGQRQ